MVLMAKSLTMTKKSQMSTIPEVDENPHKNPNHQRLIIQVASVAFLAMIHLFLIANLLNSSTTVIRITYTREAVRSAARTTGEYLLQALEDFSHLSDTAGIVRSPAREKEIKALFHAEGRDDTRMDPTLLCKIVAEKQQSEGGAEHPPDSEPTFEEPLAAPQSRTIVLSSYFASRVDPTRCWQYTAGHLPRNSFSAFKPWYDAVERLGLTALVFHDDSLSADYVSGSGTAAILFQKVTLGRPGWSLDDERWAVYHSWLQTPAAANIEWVLHIDALEAVIAHDPFHLIENRAAEYKLWVHSQAATRRDTEAHERCAAGTATGSRRGPATIGTPTLDASVIGGSKEAFQLVTKSIVDELERLHQVGGSNAWNCHAPALNSVMARDAAFASVPTFRGGYPFCGSTDECIHDGICDHAVYTNLS